MPRRVLAPQDGPPKSGTWAGADGPKSHEPGLSHDGSPPWLVHGEGLTPEVAFSGLRSRPSATGRERIDALDGLRAVALLIIMGYHFGLGWLGGGFFSLDIFYVLSGYLITGLLVGEYRKRGGIKLPAFWARRARRLLPALLIVLVVVTLMVRFAEPAGLYPGFRMNALSALFYFSNWWQIAASSNYFTATGAVSPLTHTWSLAVEEQFYLIWPLVVLAVMHLSRTFTKGIRVLLVVSGIGVIASAVEMALLYHPGVDITRLYFGTDTHAQSILIGAVLACGMRMVQMRRGEDGMAPDARSRIARHVVMVVGAAGLAGTMILTYTLQGTDAFDYRGGFTLSALSAAALITGAVCLPHGPIARVLSLRVMVWIGTISYGAYLWHYPIFVYLDAPRTGLTDVPLLVVRFAATFALAALSFYLVERPVMYGTFWRSFRSVVPAATALAVTVAVVLTGTATATAAPSVRPVPESGSSSRPGATRVLMLGDSTALTLSLSLSHWADASHDGLDIINNAVEGCGVTVVQSYLSDGTEIPAPTRCNSDTPGVGQWPALLGEELMQYRPKAVILLAGRWETYDAVDAAGQSTNITQPTYARYVEGQLQRFVTISVAGGCHVVLMTTPYFDSGDAPNGQISPEDEPGRVRDYNRLVRDVADANPRTVSLVNLNTMVSRDGRFTAMIGNTLVRAPDGVHFPFFNVFDEGAHDPDTLAEVKLFSRFIGPKVLPTVVKATDQ